MARKPLTQRQKQVLRLVREGHTDQQIASELGIEIGTVRTRLTDIRHNVGGSDREEWVRNAEDLGEEF